MLRAVKSDDRRTGALLVVAAATLWSMGGVGVKVADAQPLVIAGLRAAFALSFMAIVGVLQGLRASDVRALVRRPLVWAAAVSYATMVVCFVLAAKRTTAANAIFIQYVGPVYVAILGGPLLGERASRRDLFAVAMCIAGMGLAFGGELGGGRAIGNVLAIVSSFGFAGLPLMLRLDQPKLEGPLAGKAPLFAMVLGNAIATVVALPAIVRTPPHDTRTVLVLFGLGTLQIGLPYVLYGVAVRRLRALESSLLATIEPVLSPVWVVFATGERPSPMAIAGGGLIVFAVAAQALGRR
jgi:DME family drug/metabolite transporter